MTAIQLFTRQIQKSLHPSFRPPVSYLRSYPSKVAIRNLTSFSFLNQNPVSRFFTVTKQHLSLNGDNMLQLLEKKTTLRALLLNLDSSIKDNYAYENFIFWLSTYIENNSDPLCNYFSGTQDLKFLCNDFIRFCFSNNIRLDKTKTLQSFEYHNQLSDTAVKNELLKIKPKETLNLLGFGLDEGVYEKHLAQHLLSIGLAKSINLFGFDPYAKQSEKITYLSSSELIKQETPSFDLIIARWVLHHVELKSRWADFIQCINKCSPGSAVLVVEHGFLKNPSTPEDKKLYHLLNATFDIIVNIGLRPDYFTGGELETEGKFFLHYLEPKDFNRIRKNAPIYHTHQIYDVGPVFPNQTIFRMNI